MSKPNIIKRIATLEQITGSKPKLVVGIRDVTAYEGVKVNGFLMSEAEFERFAKALPQTTLLQVFEIIANQPPKPS